jgi:hypothetical protein
MTKEVAFLHKDSKSLLAADLLFNLPPKEQYSKSKKATFSILTGAFNPRSYAHKRFVWSAGSDKEYEISSWRSLLLTH